MDAALWIFALAAFAIVVSTRNVSRRSDAGGTYLEEITCSKCGARGRLKLRDGDEIWSNADYLCPTCRHP